MITITINKQIDNKTGDVLDFYEIIAVGDNICDDWVSSGLAKCDVAEEVADIVNDFLE
jgi:hypothetical protein